jgi:8-oxo-dGTP pyrophosphatase MutT (NUDIX family)
MGRKNVGKSYLAIVQNADNYPYDADPSGSESSYYELILEGDAKPHGYLLPETVSKMPWTSSFEISHGGDKDRNDGKKTVKVLDSSQGKDSANAFTAAFKELVDRCIAQDTFRTIAKTHSEPFSILSYPSSPRTRTETGGGGGTGAAGTVTMERFMAPLFGILLQGAHMVAYVSSRATMDDSGMIQGLWIPRRAKHLFSSPGMLDATVAGGIAAGTTALETIIREASEEASLSPDLVRARVRSTGILSYIGSTDASHGWPGEQGLFCPGIIYTYDMELSEDVIPKPHDGEVGSYTLMSVGDVQTALLNNEFKPDAAVVVVSFLIRHGLITAENERNFIRINEHIHRRLPFRVADS